MFLLWNSHVAQFPICHRFPLETERIEKVWGKTICTTLLKIQEEEEDEKDRRMINEALS